MKSGPVLAHGLGTKLTPLFSMIFGNFAILYILTFANPSTKIFFVSFGLKPEEVNMFVE